MDISPAPDLMTRAEVAQLLRVSDMTVMRWAKAGRLTELRPGPRRVLYRRADVLSLLENGDAA